MNTTQRFLLIFFAVMILLTSETSYAQTEGHLKWFLVSTLLFFALSPRLWFHPKHIQSEEVKVKEEHDVATKFTSLICQSLPSIGFPTSEKLLILKALFKIRCAEIGSIYCTFRNYQKKNADTAWIPIFIKEYAMRDTYHDFDPWANSDTDTSAVDQTTEVFALSICEKRHYNSFFGPEKIHESKVADIKLALFFWSFGTKKMIQHLQEIRAFELIEEKILELMKEYMTLEDVTEKGSFDGIFKEDGSEPKIEQSLKKLTVLWADISRLLKMSLLMHKLQDNNANENQVDIDADLMREIEALSELEKHLNWAITEDKGLGSRLDHPNNKLETFFMKRLKLNPFWEDINSHG